MQWPAVSGDECVRVLTHLGFHVAYVTSACVRMRRDSANAACCVDVPNVRALDDEALWAILRAAKLTQVEFLDVLSEVSLPRIRVARAS